MTGSEHKKKQRVRGSQEEDALKDAQDAEGRDIRFEVFCCCLRLLRRKALFSGTPVEEEGQLGVCSTSLS